MGGEEFQIDWTRLTHAYGAATDVPAMLAALRDAENGAEALSDLYGSITHQGTRYSATPVAVSLLADAALDPAVVDRVGVLFLLTFSAIGYVGEALDWQAQRTLQSEGWEQESWMAVAGQQPRLQELLDDSDDLIARAAMVPLAWTGDMSGQVREWIGQRLQSSHGVDQCTALIASVVLGIAPEAERGRVVDRPDLARFGQAIADLRFGGSRAVGASVDELCAVFASIDAGKGLTDCEFVMGEAPEHVAACGLANTPSHLQRHAQRRLLTAIKRGWVLGSTPLATYLRLVLGPPGHPVDASSLDARTLSALRKVGRTVRSWQPSTVDGQIYELAEYGLPSTGHDLPEWAKKRS